MAKVLLVDDEEMLLTSLRYALGKEGFIVATAADGPEALEQAESFRPDLILLDVMLPGVDGFQVCRALRAKADDTPVILLTAKDQIGDRVNGLDLGADDYVTKPFNTRELVSRVHAVLRRKQRADRTIETDRELVARLEELVRSGVSLEPVETTSPGPPPGGTLRAGPIEIDPAREVVKLRGKPIELSSAELRLLIVLVREAGRVVTRTELLEEVFGRGAREGLTLLEAHIRTVREKIERDPTTPRWIVGVPGIGYVFSHESDRG